MKKKFADSFNGLKIALKHKAVLTQCILGVMAIIGGLIISLDYYEWLAYIICIFMVISMEIMNTAVERIADYL
ncbi:MAG: diacylglycerol kinase family protein, partial [Erysipelotrichaceae bacterium]|nr:diacylglycerol kinase family protein [Erysipelotrichaceae bacterium]